jgi:hypothetical protein
MPARAGKWRWSFFVWGPAEHARAAQWRPEGVTWRLATTKTSSPMQSRLLSKDAPAMMLRGGG